MVGELENYRVRQRTDRGQDSVAQSVAVKHAVEVLYTAILIRFGYGRDHILVYGMTMKLTDYRDGIHW